MGFRKGSVCFSEASVFISRTAWRHIPEDVPMLLCPQKCWLVYPTLQRSVFEYTVQKITYKYLITKLVTLETRRHYVERPENFTST